MENLNVRLDTIYSLPESFLTIDPRDVHTILPNPTLIELKSTSQKPPLFVSTLLHGNETTGFYALQRLLKRYVYGEATLPRDLIILIGNIEAAKYFQRRLEGQLDYNRIWDSGSSPEHAIAQQVLDYLKLRKPFACIDIHNNTGMNPFYGGVNKLDAASLRLAQLFSNQIVYFTYPEQVLSVALNQFTTAVIIESGRAGEAAGIERVYRYIEQVLNLPYIETDQVKNSDVNLFHSIARIRMPGEASFVFDKKISLNHDFTFTDNIESLNFLELAENTCLGWRNNKRYTLEVINEHDEDISDEVFRYDNGEIRIKRQIIPSMFCTSEKIIRQDCFGYIMQRYTID